MSAHLIAIGTPVVDHVFDRRDGIYRGSSCLGGSAVNVLVNCAEQIDTRFIGDVGSDALAQRFATELERAGVAGDLSVRGRGKTFQLFQTPVLSAQSIFPEVRPEGAAHSFGATCPVCAARPNDLVRSALVTSSRMPDLARLSVRPRSVVVFLDRVNKTTEFVSQHARTLGQVVVLDIGRTDQLRFLPASRLLALLQNISILFASTATLDSIARRTGLDRQSLVGFSGGVVVELRGAQGFVVHSSFAGPQSRHVAAAGLSGVIDDAGAGDALISGVCEVVAQSGARLTGEVLELGLERGLTRVARVLAARGALGHIRALTPIVDEAAADDHGQSSCPFAEFVLPDGTSAAEVRSATVERSRSRQNVGRMLNRALFAAESGGPQGLAGLLTKTSDVPLVVLGTGGSTAAAEFIADATRRLFHRAAFAMKPREYLVANLRNVDVLGVSYSGKSADVLRALEYDADHGGRPRLLTGATRNKLAAEDVRIEILSYGAPGRSAERGFLSFAGTVAPCVATANALLGESSLQRLTETITRDGAAWRALGAAIGRELHSDPMKVLHVLYAGEMRSAAVDLESKLVESGIGTVVLHELKDFTHGRFMSIDPQVALRPAVVLTMTIDDAGDYARALNRALDGLDLPKFDLTVDGDPVQDSLTSLFAIQYLFVALASEFGLDPSRPRHLEQKFIRLYRRTKNPAL